MTYRTVWKNARKQKFNAKSCEYNGRFYHSKREASHAMLLDWKKKAGEVVEWKPQYKIDIKVNDIHITNYYCDFRVEYKDGTIRYEEVKGFATTEWQLKWRLLQALKDELLEPWCELIVIK